jgi:hypothetical protein
LLLVAGLYGCVLLCVAFDWLYGRCEQLLITCGSVLLPYQVADASALAVVTQLA